MFILRFVGVSRVTFAVLCLTLPLPTLARGDIIEFDFRSSNPASAPAFDGETSGFLDVTGAGGISLRLQAEVIYFGPVDGSSGSLNITVSGGLTVDSDIGGTSDNTARLDAVTGDPTAFPLPSDDRNRSEGILFRVTQSNATLTSLSLVGLTVNNFTDSTGGTDDTPGVSGVGVSDEGRIVFSDSSFLTFDEDAGTGAVNPNLNIGTGNNNDVIVTRALGLGEAFIVRHYAGDGFGLNTLRFEAEGAVVGAAVPEPSTWAVLSLLAFGIYRRRAFAS